METWLSVAVLAVCLFLPIITLILWNNKIKSHHGLPPGPHYIPIITTVQWISKPFSGLEQALVSLRAKYGPIFTIRIFSRPSIFVSHRSLAHRALVLDGAVFSDRPPADRPLPKLFSCNQHTINSASYGSTWRTLRRNLASEILHPSRVKSFSPFRKWALRLLLGRLRSDSESSGDLGVVKVIDHLQYVMFCLLLSMCFGQRLEEKQIREIEGALRRLLVGSGDFGILNFLPPITRILFRKRWQKVLQLLKDQDDTLVPLIRARKHAKEHRLVGDDVVVSYADTLLELELPEEEENRKLEEDEMVGLCAEFLSAGTDTTSTALQWIMANVVKYPHVQGKLVEEIGVVMTGEEKEEVEEEDLQKLPYLKAVVLEGLRRHPPGHFLLPHTVTEDTVLGGYLVPKKGTVNFMVAEIGWDPEVWEDPMAFKPERFLQDQAFDITGTKEIKMMPFGAGRRICPGYNLAMLHLEYFVANLVWNFDWKVPAGGTVDLSEKQEFTVVMKNPLQAHITPRRI